MKRTAKASPIWILIGLIAGVLAIIFSFPLQFCDDFGCWQKLAGCMQIAGACLLTYALPHLLTMNCIPKSLCSIIGVISVVVVVVFLLPACIVIIESPILKWSLETVSGIVLAILFFIAEQRDQDEDRRRKKENRRNKKRRGR